MATLDIAGYRVEDLFAEGEGWQLLRARRQLQEEAVLLLLPTASLAQAQVLLRAHAGLKHQGLASVLDIGETGEGRLYAALGTPPGQTLALALRQGLDLEQACQLLRRLATTVAYLVQRGAPAPDLDPEAIVLDARQRPVLTRLKGPSSGSAQPRLIEQLGRHFHEALTGLDPDPAAWPPSMPDYLARWQPLIDGCLGPVRLPSVAALLAELDRLEGRPGTPAASEAGQALPPVRVPEPATPSKPPSAAGGGRPDDAGEASLSAAVPAVPAVPAADAPTLAGARPKPTELPDKATETEAGGADREPTAGRPGDALETALAEAESAAGLPPHLRQTAPSKALAPERSGSPPADSALPVEPAGPSRSRPLLLWVAVIGLPLLAGLAWFALMPDRGPAADARPAPARAATLAADPPQAAAPPARPTTFLDLMQAAEPEVEQFVALDPDVLATVEDPLPRFLAMARTNLEAGRLVEPPTRNALERFLQALSIEAGNREAEAGLRETAARCLRGEATEPTADLLRRIACAEQVAAAHAPIAASVREDITRLRAEAVALRLVPAREALADWQSERALDLFEQVLALDAQQAEARAGADEARRQGRPGYSFRDRLRDGGDGPEMRIAAGLAWARLETTVEAFSRYWEAAGQARFGASMPSCRDRESLLRSSRRRSWRQPELPQTDQHPVVCISAAMADHYAEWLSAQTGQAYRLPRRSEWERLAGEPPLDCSANFRDAAAASGWNAREALACSDGHAHTAPAGSLPPGPGGLQEIWGNAAEWLADCAAPNCRERLAAGGSWFSDREQIRVRGFAAEAAFTTIGVRVVRELPPQATAQP